MRGVVVNAALALTLLAPSLVAAEDKPQILGDVIVPEIWNSQPQRGDIVATHEVSKCFIISYEGRTTDYDGQKVSTEHTIEHLDDPTLFGEDYEFSGHGNECWEYCHPDNRFGTCLYSSFLMSYLREAVKNSFFRNDS